MQRAVLTGVLIMLAAVSGCREREPDPPDVTETTAIPTPSAPQVRIELVPAQPSARTSAAVRVQITTASESPASLEPVAGSPVHLVAVNRDLSWYEHLHPRADGDSWTTAITFPAEDDYILHVIARPANFSQIVHKQSIRVGGGRTPTARKPLETSPREKRGGDYTIQLRTNPDPPAAGIWNSLVFNVSRNGEPVTNLTPTGSLGHMVILAEGGEDFVYAHSTDGEALGGIRGRAHVRATPGDSHRGHIGDTGPEVTFHSQFPRVGKYKIWVEFLADNESVKSDFVIDAGRLKPVPDIHSD